ncbi:MAG: gamma-glutamyl-phosphate reductase [Leptolyngbyaceae cyanobacterium MO_188.B28]|nr:gamma-glutamyl-phosphate reductase [Leptolyngbyaceae cyanobacterium MO_188.B28]
MSTVFTTSDLTRTVCQVRQAASKLATANPESQSQALASMAQAILDYQNDILEANTLDLEASREMAIPDLVLDWLKLTPERLQSVATILQRLAALDNLSPQTVGLSFPNPSPTYWQLTPLGVVALIYEAFPELGAIAAGLCIRTGNGLVLKGSGEASQSNQMISQVLRGAIADVGLPEDSLLFLPPDQGDIIRNLVAQTQDINLVIPYGRPSLVQQVVKQSTIPVLPCAMGNCYLFWTLSGNLETVYRMIVESRQEEPDPVNSIEKVLVHEGHSNLNLTRLWSLLREEGYTIRGDNALVAEFPDLELASPSEWKQSYLDKTIAFKRVNSLSEAAILINQNSSGHANCLATELLADSRQFTLEVHSCSLYINTSPSFSRNPKQGTSISLGMSSQEGRSGGLIGLEALTRIKRIMNG